MVEQIMLRPITHEVRVIFMNNDFERYHGDGIYLWIDGRKYFDCASGTFNLALGYSAQEVVEAVKNQLYRCAHLSSEFTLKKQKEVFELLKEFLPEQIDDFWFRDIIGSTANECAIKIAQKVTGNFEVISLFLSHHGQSMFTTDISGNAFRKQNLSYSDSCTIKIPVPDCNHCFYCQNNENCDVICAQRLEDFIVYGSCGRIAAFIMEPILGNGGNIVPDKRFYKIVREICSRYDILVIADEVQTGFGRTGDFFASCGYAEELKPDIITFAKGAGGIGIPVAGVLMRKELNILERWEHSTTSGANPLALVSLEETIKYIKEKNILNNVVSQSHVLKKCLLELAEEFRFITNIRGIGLMYAFDLESIEQVNIFLKLAHKNGLILRSSRYGFGKTIKVRPPLIVNTNEIFEITSLLRKTLIDMRGVI